MKSASIHGLTIYYDAAEAETADLIRQACDRCVPVLTGDWGLRTPADGRIYVMT
jgi:hypothetical protein